MDFILTFLFQISSFLPEDLSLAPGLQSLNLKGKKILKDCEILLRCLTTYHSLLALVQVGAAVRRGIRRGRDVLHQHHRHKSVVRPGVLLDCRESPLFLLVTPELVLGGQSVPLFSSTAEV